MANLQKEYDEKVENIEPKTDAQIKERFFGTDNENINNVWTTFVEIKQEISVLESQIKDEIESSIPRLLEVQTVLIQRYINLSVFFTKIL